MRTFDLLRRAAPTLSVGVLSADWMALGADLEHLAPAAVPLLHFDVMDGRLVPALTLGAPLVRAVRTPMRKDVHLMVEEPLDRIEAFVAAGADVITVSVESTRHVHRVFQRLGEMENANDPARGLVRAAALNPGTPVEAVEPLLGDIEMVLLLAVNPGWGGQSFLPSTRPRLERLRELIDRSGRDLLTCVDGGITRDTIGALAGSGVDLVVSGSAVFDGGDPAENARLLLDRLRSGN